MGLRGGLPFGARAVLGDRPTQGNPHHRLRPRRQRGLARGRRIAVTTVPTRTRSSRWHHARRSPRHRHPQGGAEAAAGALCRCAGAV
ncbi:UNVERIFIED_CONTAM: hypothetical protein GTU68_002167 [Idotea baltica]|nr:hypothetical protein [Idotea baltica]